MFFSRKSQKDADDTTLHAVLDTPLQGPYPDGSEKAFFGLGCFWGAERIFWQIPGVITTAVGYQGGASDTPDYKSVCSGTSGHAENVLVVHNPDEVEYSTLLQHFWQAHDPTQGNRQGNDMGSQYRSMIVANSEEQYQQALNSRDVYSQALQAAGKPSGITTEIVHVQENPFHFAEAYHQQYLRKNPRGYCGLGGTGVTCPILSSNLADGI